MTRQGRMIGDLYQLELVLSTLLLALVVGVLVVAIVRFRGRPGDPEPPQREGSRRLEIAWTALPALLLAGIFLLVLQTMAAVDAASPSALRIRVIGHQWWWEFRYPDLGIVTANELHVPVNTPLRLELESVDVIHSFWVPQFGWMRDAIPGRTNVMSVQVTAAGTFEGACTQYCGLQHAWMRDRVVAQPRAEFDAWVQQQQRPAATAGAAARGEQLFLQSTCVSCHTIRGTPANGQVGPDLTHLASRQTIAGGVLKNTPQNVQRWIENPQAIKPGVLMPSFRSLSDRDLQALATYLEALK